MATDLNKKRRLPVLPSAANIRKRLEDVERDAKKLKLMLRLASEMESLDEETARK